MKISTHLWFDKEAVPASEFYSSVFEGSKINHKSQINDTPSGTVDIVSMTIFDHEFAFLSAGPTFKINPSISFLIACKTKEEVADLWVKLSTGGNALMELDHYPFSEKYGWITDKFGVSWQIMYMGDMEVKQKLTPTIMFIGDKAGKTEEALSYWTSIFHDSQIGDIMRYSAGQDPDKEGTIAHATFKIEGQWFAAMDSAQDHKFQLNEAISFIVSCENQKEIDYYWQLSAVPESEQCGWLKDKYGVSWQIVPKVLDIMMSDEDKSKVARVTDAFLKMKKMDIEGLEKAYQG